MATAARVALAAWLSALLVGLLVSDAQGIVTVAVSNAFGPPGGTATVMIGVNNGHGDVLDVALDLFFDATNLDIGTADCTVAARLAGSHSLSVFLPADPAPPGQRRLRLGLFDLSAPLTPFTDGAIAMCTFSIAAGAGLGTTYPLVLDPAHLEVIDSSIPPMTLESTGEDGSIAVGEGLVTLCPGTPRGGCRSALKSLLVIKDKRKDKKDTLTWKWLKGTATNRDELADPTTDASYGLCVYSNDQLILTAAIGPSHISWSPVKQKGFKYKDKGALADGVVKAALKAGKAGKAKAVVKGKGAKLPDLNLAMVDTPVRVQLFNSSTGLCLESTYEDDAVLKRSAKKLKLKVAP